MKTENMRPMKPSSRFWYMACVRTSTCDGSTVMCGWLWYLHDPGLTSVNGAWHETACSIMA